MKKLLWCLLLIFSLPSVCLAAWDPTKPGDSDVRKQAPAQIRANWDAIELGTDPDLQVTNAKVADNAAIADSKLAQITSAAKVSGTALTGLSSIPSSSNGQVPIANGGTGQSTATAARNALLPTQTGNSGKALITDATNVSWGYPAGLTIASAAQGDLLYYSGSAWVRLAPGTSGQFLQTQGAGANPLWALDSRRKKVGSFTRDVSASDGTDSITGIGFQPTVVIFFAGIGSSLKQSYGIDDGTSHFSISQKGDDGSTLVYNTHSICICSDGATYSRGYVSAFGADGFTVTWAKTGSPTGTATVFYLALE